MEGNTAIIESGPAGKPGESTAQKNGANGAGNHHDTLTAAGVEDLLKSELAALPPTPEEGEVQATAGESETKDQGTKTEATEEQENKSEDEGEKEDEDEGKEAEQTPVEETGELPAELQAAIEQWETNGKGELPAVLQSLVERRIGKLTAQREQEKSARETAEARAQELAAENERLKVEAPIQQPQGPRMDEQTLGRIESAANTFLNDAENYLDDTATPQERERVEKLMQAEGLDASSLKRRVRETNRWLNSELPQRRQQAAAFRQQESANEPEAMKQFPWLWDKASPEYAMAQEVLKVMPDLPQRTPGHRMALGIYVLGLKEFERMQKAGAKPAVVVAKPAVKAPLKTPANGSAAPRAAAVNGKEKQASAIREQFNRAPTRDNVTELLKVELR